MEGDPDSRALGVVLLLTTAPVVAITLLAGRTFGASATLCLLLFALGIGSLRAERRDSTSFPRARVRRGKR